MKKCFKCGKEKELSEFYIHKGMVDGHLGKCKSCAKKYGIEYRNKHIDRMREYDRQRSKLPHRMKASSIRTKIRRKQNPIQYAAHILLYDAVKNKKIKKSDCCQKCGRKTKISGHHDDYYKPLDVIWLCQICHSNEHQK